MKKLISIIALAAAFSFSANAQTVLGDLLGGIGVGTSSSSSSPSTASSIGNIISGLAGTVFSSPVSLNGTYTYNGIAVSATSSEGGVLTNLAGSAVTSGIETKIDEYLAKVGIKPGAMQYFCMTGTLESSLNGAKMLFTSQKAVAFLKKVASKLGESNSQIGSIAKMADGYDNFRIGFKLAK